MEAHLQALHERLKTKNGARHQPIRRVHLPKAQGKPRPLGLSAFEDKLVQDAVREVLEAVPEEQGAGWTARMASGPGAVPLTPCVP